MTLIIPERYRVLPQSTTIARAVVEKMSKGLLRDVPGVASRLQIFSDDQALRYTEDAELLAEVRRGYYYFTAMFDGVTLTYFDTNSAPSDVELRIYLAYQDALKRGKIYTDIKGYEHENELKKAEEKEINDELDRVDLSGATKEEKLISHAVVTELKKQKNKKQIKIPKKIK